MSKELENHSWEWRPRALLLIFTLATYLILWLLFELQRAPYTPNGNETLLGRDAAGIPVLMGMIGFIWLVSTIFWWCQARFSIKDLMLFTGLIAVLVAMGVKIVKYPSWPVAKYTVIPSLVNESTAAGSNE
jgi:hypothetical protein